MVLSSDLLFSMITNIFTKNLSKDFKTNFKITNFIIDADSSEYNGCDFNLSCDKISKQIKFRIGKLTPNKLGYFISCWKRDLVSNKTIPYDYNDSFDYLIVYIQDKEELFIFPKSILIDKQIISKNNSKNINGKRGFRLYIPSNKLTSKQAIDTQKWQSNFYFKNISEFLSGNI